MMNGWASYDDYLRSEEWKATNRWYRMSRELPQSCLVCNSSNFVLHHCTYDNLGFENLSDFMPLCDEHHSAIHDLERRKKVKLFQRVECLVLLGLTREVATERLRPLRAKSHRKNLTNKCDCGTRIKKNRRYCRKCVPRCECGRALKGKHVQCFRCRDPEGYAKLQRDEKERQRSLKQKKIAKQRPEIEHAALAAKHAELDREDRERRKQERAVRESLTDEQIVARWRQKRRQQKQATKSQGAMAQPVSDDK